jgi:hypothetical protein
VASAMTRPTAAVIRSPFSMNSLKPLSIEGLHGQTWTDRPSLHRAAAG